jgi:hypothetical protein
VKGVNAAVALRQNVQQTRTPLFDVKERDGWKLSRAGGSKLLVKSVIPSGHLIWIPYVVDPRA